MPTNTKKIAALLSAALLLSIASCSSEGSSTAPAAAQAGETKAAAPAADGPKITLSTEVVYNKGWVTMKGSGFTPKADIRSHLRRPNGTEFPVLPILTNEKGEFTHEIDSLLLLKGTHDVWVEDSTTGKVSNTAHFDVTLSQAPQK